jgi:hypothetical protein
VARAAYLVGGPVDRYEPDPMSGQFRVEPEPEPEPELPPVLPVLVLLLDGDGVVVEEPAPEPVPDVGPDVVAALATNAPPVRRPAVSAPTASTLRTRCRIWRYAFRLW